MYATLPVAKMGQLLMYSQRAAQRELSDTPPFSGEDIDAACELFRPLRYQQLVTLAGARPSQHVLIICVKQASRREPWCCCRGLIVPPTVSSWSLLVVRHRAPPCSLAEPGSLYSAVTLSEMRLKSHTSRTSGDLMQCT